MHPSSLPCSWPAEAQEFLDEWLDEKPHVEVRTSGSTGKPKLIRLLKEDMRLQAEATCRFFRLGPDSVLACPLSADYIAAKMMIVRSVISGSALFFESASAHPLASFTGLRIDLLPIVPYQTAGLVERLSDHRRPLDIGNIIVGGAALTDEQRGQLMQLDANVYATYGMTETASHVALCDITSGSELFSALPGYEFSTDARGCLVISNPRMSWRAMVTNDLVELADSNNFKPLGRADNIINSGGIKIIPELVEEAVRKLWPGVECCLTSRAHPQLGHEAVLVVDVNTPLPCGVTIEEVRRRLAPLLPNRYWAPRGLISLPLTRTDRGKLIRRPL